MNKDFLIGAEAAAEPPPPCAQKKAIGPSMGRPGSRTGVTAGK